MASEMFTTVATLIGQSTAGLEDVSQSAREIRAGIEGMLGAMVLVDGATAEAVDVGGIPSEWVRPANGVVTDACVLYLHGGGYVIGSVNTHRAVASHLAARLGLPVLVIDYRLAPEHPYPAAVDDALTAYEWLLAQGFEPGRIAVAGDSAGGGLTLALLLALHDRGRPLPALGVPISPWTDLTISGASMDAQPERDPLISRPGLQLMADWYVGSADANDPLVSPLFADPTGLPPLLIHVGEYEALLDDAVRFAARAEAAGVDVTLEVWPEMIHVWHVFGPGVPESEAAVTRIAEYVAGRLGVASPTPRVSMSISGYAALVTGGGSGIGLGAARRLAADGAHVTICGRTEDRLREAVEQLQGDAAPGREVRYAVADVTKEDDVAGAVAVATETTGGLDVLFACAGGSLHLGPIVLSDVESFRATLDLNITGTFLAIKHAAPVMARSGGGSIIGMSSIAGVSTHKYMSAYCVGKAGIEMLVKVAADELGPSGIRVNAVQPGLVDTDLVGFITEGGDLLDDYIEQMPIARVGTVDDIAAAVRFLAGPEATWITGQMLGIDGGHQLRRGPNYGLFVEPMYGADACRGLIETG